VRPLATVFLLAVLAWRLRDQWGAVATAFTHLNVALWLVAVGVYVSVQAISSVRWRMLGKVQGYDAPIGAYLAFYYIGMFFNLVLPTTVGGDVVRVWYLANRDGTGPRVGRRMAALVSVLAERVNGLVVLIFLACVAVIFSPTVLPPWISGTVAAVGAVAVLGLIAVPFLGWLFRKYPVLDRQPRLAHVRSLLAGALAYRGHPGMLFQVTLLSVFVQVGNVVMWWLVSEGLGLHVSLWYCGVMVPLVTLVATFVPSIGGFGVREAATVILLAPLQVSAADAVTLSILGFAASAVCSLGGLLFYLFGRYPRYSAHQPAAMIEDTPVLTKLEERRLAS
jgi:glycosyltransferase 2 family protein